jgi:catechol 2,3-dioxygenase
MAGDTEKISRSYGGSQVGHQESSKEEMVSTIEHVSIHLDTQIGTVTLAVSDLERSVRFYTDVLGFSLIERSARAATLGVEQMPLLVLEELPGARPQPPRTTGLYHFAILVPTRKDLARSLRRLAVMRYPLLGSSDHLVSEALYLDDPDGNGIEIYRDRPRDSWQWNVGQVQMAVDPLDVNGILAELDGDDGDWQGLAAGTRIGHIHLRVADLQQAADFYHKLLGFDVVAQMPGALFVSAGGYHHHIGLNTWQSRGAPEPPADAAGLRSFTIDVPDVHEQVRIVERLEAVGIDIERQPHGVSGRDPWHNRIVLRTRTQG